MPKDGKLGFTIAGGLQEDCVTPDPLVRVGEVVDPPAIDSEIQPQDRIMAVNGKVVTVPTEHRAVVAMLSTAAATGVVRLMLSRADTKRRSEHLDRVAPPFFIRAACAWCATAAFPTKIAASLGVLPLHFEPRDVLEILGTTSPLDVYPSEKGKWWHARMLERAGHEPPLSGNGIVEIIPSSHTLEGHVMATRQQREYTQAAREARRISADAQARPLSYQRLVKVDANDYSAKMGMRPLCLFGPATAVSAVSEQLFVGAARHGLDCVRPILATTRTPQPHQVNGVDFHFWSAEEAMTQIENGSTFVIQDQNDGDDLYLPIESIVAPAKVGHVVVMCERDEFLSMHLLSNLVQRVGSQPIVVRLDPEHSDDPGTLVAAVERIDGLKDPNLAEMRAHASQDAILYGHLFTRTVSCAQVLKEVVAEIVDLVRNETTGHFWGTLGYVLPRGEAPKRSVRAIKILMSEFEDDPPFSISGRYWSEAIDDESMLLIDSILGDQMAWGIHDRPMPGDEILAVNGVELNGKTWADRRALLVAASAMRQPLDLLVRHNPEALAQITAEAASHRKSRKSSMMSTDGGDILRWEDWAEGSTSFAHPLPTTDTTPEVSSGANGNTVITHPEPYDNTDGIPDSSQSPVTPMPRYSQHTVIIHRDDSRMLGFQVRTINQGNSRVGGITLGSPASRSLLEVGDLILSINGLPTDKLSHHKLLNAFKTPGSVTLLVQHDRAYHTYLKGTLKAASTFPLPTTPPRQKSNRSGNGRQLPVSAAAAASDGADSDVTLSCDLVKVASGFGFELGHLKDSLPVVTDVVPGGSAERAGLRAGDTLREIGGSLIVTTAFDEVIKVFKHATPGEVVRVTMVRTFAALRQRDRFKHCTGVHMI